MSRVAAVAWRDFKQTVMRKIFLVAIFGIPAAIVASVGLIVLILATHQEPPLVGTIALVDPTGEVTPAARAEFDPRHLERDRRRQVEQMQQAGEEMLGRGGAATVGASGPASFDLELGSVEVDIDLEQHREQDGATIDGLRARVERGDLLAYAIVPDEVIEIPDPDLDRKHRPRFELLGSAGLDTDHLSFIERRLGQAVVRVRATRAGLDPEEAIAMLRRPDSRTSRVLAGGDVAEEGEGLRALKQMIPMIFMMLLWASVITSGQHLMMSTIEEKSNRVMEVLLSAVSPFQLMTGKILGQGAVGLLIVTIYSSVGIVALVLFNLTHLVSLLESLVYLFVFFFMAFFMIASIFAAVGSAVTDIREANTLVTPVMFIVMIPLFLWMPISQAPNGTVATVCSFIPPAIPFVMILRVAADEGVAQWWQIPATIVWGYACVAGMVWMAGKIFRVGVLMYGKPPSPLQMLKWVRYA